MSIVQHQPRNLRLDHSGYTVASRQQELDHTARESTSPEMSKIMEVGIDYLAEVCAEFDNCPVKADRWKKHISSCRRGSAATVAL